MPENYLSYIALVLAKNSQISYLLLMKNLIERIETDRFYMRPFDIPDAKAVQAILEKNRDNMLPWVPWASDEPESVDIKKNKIRLWKAEFFSDQKYTYGIFDAHDHHLIGIQYLFKRQGPGILEIGYIIDMDHEGKGYASQSSYALTKLGFQEMKADKMVIIFSPLNIASGKIPKNIGYHQESVVTSIDRYKDDSRIVMETQAMFPEQFKLIEKYEPVKFIKFKGWDD